MSNIVIITQKQAAQRRKGNQRLNRHSRTSDNLAQPNTRQARNAAQNANRQHRRTAASETGKGRSRHKGRHLRPWMYDIDENEDETNENNPSTNSLNQPLLTDNENTDGEIDIKTKKTVSFEQSQDFRSTIAEYDEDDDQEWEHEEDWKFTVQRDLSMVGKKQSYQEVSTPPMYVAFNDFLHHIRGGNVPSYHMEMDIIGNGRSVFGLPILSPVNTFVALITTFILIVDLVYSSFLLPFQVAFQFFNDNSIIWACIVYVTSAIFALQILLDFQIGFVHRHGTQKVMVMDGKIIALRYVRSVHFYVDLLSVLPVFLQIAYQVQSQVESNVSESIQILYHVTNILLLTRLFQVLRIVRRLFNQCYKGDGGSYVFMPSRILIVVVFAYSSLVVFNIFSCLWYTAARIHGFEDSWIAARGILDDSKPAIWLAGFYWATVTATTIGYGDISATNNVEEICAVFIMIVSVVFFAILIAVATDLFQSATRDQLRAERFRQKMVTITAWMKDNHLPQKLQKEIDHFYGDEWLFNHDLNDSNMFDELPELLAGKIAIHMTANFLPELEIFEDLKESEWKEIAIRLTPMTLLPGQDIFREPSIADAIYFIQEGEVQVTRYWQNVDYITAPDFFAENDILDGKSTDKVRMMSLVCNTQCRIWRLDVLDLKTILYHMPPETTQKIKNGIARRNFDAALDSVPEAYFSDLIDRIEKKESEVMYKLEAAENVDFENADNVEDDGDGDAENAPQIPQIIRYWEAVVNLEDQVDENDQSKLIERELMESRIYGPLPPYM